MPNFNDEDKSSTEEDWDTSSEDEEKKDEAKTGLET